MFAHDLQVTCYGFTHESYARVIVLCRGNAAKQIRTPRAVRAILRALDHDDVPVRGGHRVRVVRNVRQAAVVKVRAGPSGFLESRTRTRSGAGATSTQSAPVPL